MQYLATSTLFFSLIFTNAVQAAPSCTNTSDGIFDSIFGSFKEKKIKKARAEYDQSIDPATSPSPGHTRVRQALKDSDNLGGDDRYFSFESPDFNGARRAAKFIKRDPDGSIHVRVFNPERFPNEVNHVLTPEEASTMRWSQGARDHFNPRTPEQLQFQDAFRRGDITEDDRFISIEWGGNGNRFAHYVDHIDENGDIWIKQHIDGEARILTRQEFDTAQFSHTAYGNFGRSRFFYLQDTPNQPINVQEFRALWAEGKEIYFSFPQVGRSGRVSARAVQTKDGRYVVEMIDENDQIVRHMMSDLDVLNSRTSATARESFENVDPAMQRARQRAADEQAKRENAQRQARERARQEEELRRNAEQRKREQARQREQKARRERDRAQQEKARREQAQQQRPKRKPGNYVFQADEIRAAQRSSGRPLNTEMQAKFDRQLDLYQEKVGSFPNAFSSDFYSRLNASADMTTKEIQRQYRRASSAYHSDKYSLLPDEVQENVTERFKSLKEAWEWIDANHSVK